jgi:DNA-binding transcriptional ArsR family regulator
MNLSIFDIQAEFCKAMGNASRLQILHFLTEDPKTFSEISQATHLPQGALSRHLSVLRNVGVVISTRHGNEKLYQITDARIAEVCDLVRSILMEQSQKQSHSINIVS